MDMDRPRWRSHAWLLAVVLLALLAFILTSTGSDGLDSAWVTLTMAAVATVLVIAWALVRTRAQRRRYEDELAAWAAERAAQTERLRLAADLHDLVSHGLGLITVRAAAARSVTGSAGDAERASALTDIERTGRRTTLELRRMLGVLRAPGTAPLRPADTLDDLPAIVGDATATGLTVSLRADDIGDVSPGVQLVVCAVVREALHNTMRHAGPTDVRIDLHRDRETIVVAIRDDGPRDGWPAQRGAGHGLDGLRERIDALDGTLHAGAIGPGFHVTAHIPDRESP
ncbi:signal transduction histidine kinase [Actinoplanes tereljensis]|uniref:histidine kinase n=1 Tax=Paractinoplanes tereljensis TaxID=571912 RepID=A0A919NJV7_9ACTN|nr:histidine kinase [Actinoplanes tereljensis]GIF20064.1 hypothetical protein Ate02nite_27940 [Actinoplanes tereljensis]